MRYIRMIIYLLLFTMVFQIIAFANDDILSFRDDFGRKVNYKVVFSGSSFTAKILNDNLTETGLSATDTSYNGAIDSLRKSYNEIYVIPKAEQEGRDDIIQKYTNENIQADIGNKEDLENLAAKILKSVFQYWSSVLNIFILLTLCAIGIVIQRLQVKAATHPEKRAEYMSSLMHLVVFLSFIGFIRIESIRNWLIMSILSKYYEVQYITDFIVSLATAGDWTVKLFEIIMGFGIFTSLLAVILNQINLGIHANNPTKRAAIISAFLYIGLGTAFLGSITLIAGQALNIFV